MLAEHFLYGPHWPYETHPVQRRTGLLYLLVLQCQATHKSAFNAPSYLAVLRIHL